MAKIKNYTTSISPFKTISEIEELLGEYGATTFEKHIDDGVPTQIIFTVPFEQNGQITNLRYHLPVDIDRLLAVMDEDPKIRSSYCNYDQAARTGWRIAKDWIHAQLSFVATGMADMKEVFLPYMVDQSNKTLYESFRDNGVKLLAN